MKFLSTRGKSSTNSSYEAILKGLADDGGLYVPEELGKIDITEEEISKYEYTDYAKKVISFIFDDMNEESLFHEIDEAYKTFSPEILPIKKLEDIYIMELFHGQTYAFKDFAMSLLPRLVSLSLKEQKIDKKILILTATSGDTGSAALYGFKNIENTQIIVFYPTKGISEIQRKQMVTIDGENTYAVAVKGNFDDAQSALKEIFNDSEFKKYLEDKDYLLSSANSINIGRLVPQIVYYFYSYYDLVKKDEIKKGEEVSVSVPTGNFGNILAAYMAKRMGLPIKDLICGSNKNNILTDFINTGTYDVNRQFYTTNSPSMDILISSNLERFLYYEFDKDTEYINTLMKDLKSEGKYLVDKNKINGIYGYCYDDEETLEEIVAVYEKFGYLVDTHSAIAMKSAEDYIKGHGGKVIAAATASPFKFAPSIAKALSIEYEDEISAIDAIEDKTGIKADNNFKNILRKKVTQEREIEKDNIKNVIKEILF
ncbi:threonine synthase [Peptoniphilus sp. ING2-D1G]|nr:threonine synthase [Peptoniphilus sp. ING2-D1G]